MIALISIGLVVVYLLIGAFLGTIFWPLLLVIVIGCGIHTLGQKFGQWLK